MIRLVILWYVAVAWNAITRKIFSDTVGRIIGLVHARFFWGRLGHGA